MSRGKGHTLNPASAGASWVFAMVLCVAGGGVAAEPLIFEKTVAPILKAHCTDCHNPAKRKGELDLTTAEGLVRGGEKGPVFKAGDIKHSHLLELVESGEMPKKGDKLSASEVKSIRKWIAAGAPFATPPAALASAKINQHDVLPILLLRCTVCHGPRLQEGGVDLRSKTAMLKGGRNGPVLVPGSPEGSAMIQRIESEACPPQELLLKYFVKRPPSSEVRTLKAWIAAGAPEVDVAPDVATTEPDPLVSDEDRKHWAFQPPHKPASGKSIDEFISAKLREKGLRFSPEADRDTLIRRACMDLTGLPPSLEEWQQWRNDKAPNWYARMIDHLLASPHYGERWGRYWLDVAGYADSEGGTSDDPLREVAWKYRDYVIRAFNDDKPYDRFLLEQIAGDELADAEKASRVTSEMVDNLVATGFLRMGIDETGSRTMNFVPERLGVINDAIKVLGSGVMGLTLECVRCHTHKYDPIPQRDYYRLKAVFQGAYDEHDWMSFKTRKLQIGTPEQQARVKNENPPIQAKLKSLEAKLKKAIAAAQIETLKQHYPDQPEEDRQAALVALRKADNVRTLTQRNLVEMLQKAELKPDAEQPEPVLAARKVVQDLEQEVAYTRSQLAPPLAIRALWDRGEPSPTYILRRGEYDKPGRLVGPGVPSALTDGMTPFAVTPPFPGGTAKTGRRLGFAKWLTQPENPLTARVMVNRIWAHHFGAGIVKSVENFGVKGERPSHPELLDWLAVTFMERGWSIKELHRLIMHSQTYRQSSHVTEDHMRLDSQNTFLSRMTLRRLDAEALRDSMLFVAGELDSTPGGPPDPVVVDREGLVSAAPSSGKGWRRSVYLQYRRTEIPTFMYAFDYPEMGPNCVERTVSTVSPQALMLMNNSRVRELATAFARRVSQSHSGNDNRSAAGQIESIYQLALSRSPTAEELRLGTEALKHLRTEWRDKPEAALETYCHTILNSAAFLYVD